MSVDDLLQNGRILKTEPVSKLIRDTIVRAEDDLLAAETNLEEHPRWAFLIAYTSVLEAARALMFSSGYRPASDDGHKNTFLFIKEIAPERFKTTISYFDEVRKQRNEALYGFSPNISSAEARNLVDYAKTFVNFIGEKLRQTEHFNQERTAKVRPVERPILTVASRDQSTISGVVVGYETINETLHVLIRDSKERLLALAQEKKLFAVNSKVSATVEPLRGSRQGSWKIKKLANGQEHEND